MLRPVDMALNVGQAPDIARQTTANQAARPEMAQQMFADQMTKQTRQEQQQVTKSNKSEKGNVNPDDKNGAGGYNPKRKPAPKKNITATKKPVGSNGGSLFDVSI